MLAHADMQDTDRGPREGRRGTERLCALTREVKPVDDLIRFVAGPDGAIVPDLKRRLPGRGVWVTATRKSIDEAAKRNVFARSLKREGRVAFGFGRAETALGGVPPVLAILNAADGAPDGARKIAAAAAKRQTAENA